MVFRTIKTEWMIVAHWAVPHLYLGVAVVNGACKSISKEMWRWSQKVSCNNIMFRIPWSPAFTLISMKVPRLKVEPWWMSFPTKKPSVYQTSQLPTNLVVRRTTPHQIMSIVVQRGHELVSVGNQNRCHWFKIYHPKTSVRLIIARRKITEPILTWTKRSETITPFCR